MRGSAPSPMPAIVGIDSHAHVFERTLRWAEVRRYAPEYDATLPRYLDQLAANGFSHAVLVQPSFLGTDNRYLLAALAAEPARLRGVAVLPPATDAGELDRLASAGVTGIRLNLIGTPSPDLASAEWRHFARRLGARGWLVEIHAEAARLGALAAPLLAEGIKVVIDHFGRPDPALGVRDPGFAGVLRLAERGQVWVKVSAAYRNGSDGAMTPTARAAAGALVDAFGPHRLVWGSDWPHTQHESTRNFAREVALLHELFPDAAMRRAITVDTPAALFGWTAADVSPPVPTR